MYPIYQGPREQGRGAQSITCQGLSSEKGHDLYTDAAGTISYQTSRIRRHLLLPSTQWAACPDFCLQLQSELLLFSLLLGQLGPRFACSGGGQQWQESDFFLFILLWPLMAVPALQPGPPAIQPSTTGAKAVLYPPPIVGTTLFRC